MNHFTPFVYLLAFKPTGQFYYGSRTAEHCAKISLSRKGQKLPPQSTETKTKRADANRGKENKPRTAEQWAATAALRAFNRTQRESL